MSSQPPKSERPTIGRYELLELVGQGDIGEVFAVRSRGVAGFEKRLVAKRIRKELSQDPRFVEAFAAEARLAVTLSHTNIVQVLELGQQEGLLYIVMEYVAGPDLKRTNKALRRQQIEWPHQLAAFVVAEVAKGLDHAHRRRDLEGRPLGIVHQDVTPANVLLSQEGEVKLTDFGMASVGRRESLGRVTDPRYLAPEQIAGDQQVDARTDIYASGLLLYEMLAGHLPWPNVSRENVIKRLAARDLPKPSPATQSRLAPDLTAVLARALAPAPEDRFPDAGSLYEALMSTIFASGRIMGRHELAELLQDVGEVSETTEVNVEQVELALASWRPREAPSTVGEDSSPIGTTAESSDLVYSQLAAQQPEGEEEETQTDARLPKPLLATPMRGRRLERQRLAEAVSAAARAQRQVVSVIGAEGIGKTRLVHEVVGKLRSGGARFSFYRASCKDSMRFGRYGAARSMLRSILGVEDGASIDEIADEAIRLRELGLTRYELEALQDVAGAGPGGAPPGRRRARAVARGMANVFRRLGEEALVLAFWDDADVMDQDSARLFSRIVRHSEGAHLVLVLTLSDGDTPWREDLSTDIVEMGPLGPNPQRQLIVDTLGVHDAESGLVESIADIVGGNPRFAIELVRLLVETQAVRIQDRTASLAPGAGVPRKSIEEVIDARLALLNELERAVLELGACIGTTFETRLITATTGLPNTELQPVIEKLVSLSMLAPAPPAGCAFVHETLRKRVFETLDEEDLTEIHGRLAEAMASAEGSHEPGWQLRTASHLHHAGQRERARDLLATGAAQLEVAGATDAAIDHFSAALELTRGAEEAPVGLALSMRTASLAARAGRLREGLRAVGLATDLAQQNHNTKGEIEALILGGRLLGIAGRVEDGNARFRSALNAATKIDDEEARRRIRGAMGELLVEAGEYRRAAAHLEEAIGDPSSAAAAPRFLLMAALCRGLGGDSAIARDMLARVEAATVGGEDVTMQVGVLRVRGLLYIADGLVEEATGVLRDARNLARQHGLHHDNALASHILGCALLSLGNPQEAFASLWYSYEVGREQGFERMTRLNLVVLACLDVLANEREEPIERMLAALGEARESGLLADILETRYYVGSAFMAVGQIQDGRSQLEQARKMGHATGNLLFANDIDRQLAALNSL